MLAGAHTAVRLPKLGHSEGVPRGKSGAGAADEEANEGGGADVPLLKLFEFLTASLCLYVIDEQPSGSCPLRRKAHVYSSTASTEG
jgi:hypothetical protein